MQECHNTLVDYSAKAEENGVDITGMVYVNDGYAFVYFGGSLHLLGELDDLACLNVSTTSATLTKKDALDTKYQSKVTENVTGISENTLYITVTDKEGVEHTKAGEPAKVIYGEVKNGPVNPNDPPKHLGEMIYFYTFALNGTQYLGYFTMEATTQSNITTASFRSNETLYSRMFGYVFEDQDAAENKIALTISGTDPTV